MERRADRAEGAGGGGGEEVDILTDNCVSKWQLEMKAC